MRFHPIVLALLVFIGLGSTALRAHCQIPCGIFGDGIRLDLLEEHVLTIEKSMAQIRSLTGKTDETAQLVRWVVNKEAHAEKIIDIMTDYFLAQRIKPLEGRVDVRARRAYQEKLVTCHEIIVQAMKTKQGVDEERLTKLRTLVARFRRLYEGPGVAAHGHEHRHPGKARRR